jgi:hypothetical protein
MNALSQQGSQGGVSKKMITRAVSFPIPRLPPVIMTTFPVWSGTSAAVQVGSGGTNCASIPIRFDMAREGRGEGNR